LKTQAAMDEYKKKMKKKAEQENSNLWQHPFVDVIKLNKVFDEKDSNSIKIGSNHIYQDKLIGRQAVKIGGTSQAKN